MKVAVLTLGCKVNKYESDALIFELKNRGYDATENLEFADIYIINTCAVTNEAEKKSRQMIERARKFNPNAKVFVMGCASQNRPSQFEDRNVNFIIGTANKKKILIFSPRLSLPRPLRLQRGANWRMRQPSYSIFLPPPMSTGLL